MLDKTIFAQNFSALGVVYDKTLTKTLHDIYYAILRAMENEDFKQAIRRLLSERVYPTFPKPAEILELSNVKKEVILEVDETEEKAKELIELVQGMNGQIYKDHIETGTSFDTLLDGAKFPSVDDETISILERVRTFDGSFGLKYLIANISRFQDYKMQIGAFKKAIKNNSGSILLDGERKCLVKKT